jgi:hypothetical protein
VKRVTEDGNREGAGPTAAARDTLSLGQLLATYLKDTSAASGRGLSATWNTRSARSARSCWNCLRVSRGRSRTGTCATSAPARSRSFGRRGVRRRS